ncbi:PLP-dependent aminotransferase family protein [Tropicimonas sediminicola]|uniref:DNA-binding transcriptional regulator, MocR family, contains an aminotransferase domain n=1 Tax=Tropicimonas sediminicola TaxID=1031541 RepID=A0A239MD74_9RHOB|nr:PLP-dependent aminotransferase family protein [Tropicimonas sediminicola]SNT40685.1 DNA-binding transcriptional regulator, MocR family, contains an aminotransferase domain [Tropicimonas sediminicola]
MHLSPLVTSIPENPLRALFPYAGRPGMLNLASGHPSRDAYDVPGLEAAAAAAASEANAWSYGPAGGDPDLIEALAGLSAPVPKGHRLLVTSGAQQAVDLALRALAPPGSRVLLPEPIYPAILSLCAAAGIHPLGYSVAAGDQDLAGLAGTLAEGHIRAIYALPTFSNPTGESWSRRQRLRMLELCAAAGVPVVEDDPYRMIHLDAPPPSSLAELSRKVPGVVVVHAGSLSKFVAPGLRLGWAIAPAPLAQAMQELRQATDLQPNSFAQRVAVHYLRSGRVEAHLERVRALYAARKTALASVLHLAGFDVPNTGGGMFLFPRLPEGQGADALFERAVAANVLIAPGRAFALPGRGAGLDDRVRLCFAGLSEERIREAAQRLVGAMERAES